MPGLPLSTKLNQAGASSYQPQIKSTLCTWQQQAAVVHIVDAQHAAAQAHTTGLGS